MTREEEILAGMPAKIALARAAGASEEDLSNILWRNKELLFQANNDDPDVEALIASDVAAPREAPRLRHPALALFPDIETNPQLPRTMAGVAPLGQNESMLDILSQPEMPEIPVEQEIVNLTPSYVPPVEEKAIGDMSEAELSELSGVPLMDTAEVTDFKNMSEADLRNEIASGYTRPTEPKVEASLEDRRRGNAGMRFLKGVADPLIGALQVGANAGDMLYDEILDFGKGTPLQSVDFKRSEYRLGEDLNTKLKEYQDSADRGRRALNPDAYFDIDAAGGVGQVLTGASALWGRKGLSAILGGGAVGGAIPDSSGGEDFWQNQALSTGMGLGGGAVFEGIGAGLNKTPIPDWLASVGVDAKSAAARSLQELIGEDRLASVVSALKKDINPLANVRGTAAEVASEANSAPFSAVQQLVDELPENINATVSRDRANDAARMQVVGDIADMEARGITNRAAIVDPLREEVIDDAVTNTAQLQGLNKTIARLEGDLPANRSPVDPTASRSALAPDEVAIDVRNVPNAVRDAAGTRGKQAQLEQAVAAIDKTAASTMLPSGVRMPAKHAKAIQQQERAELTAQQANIAKQVADADSLEVLVKSELQIAKAQRDAMAAEGISLPSANPIIQAAKKALNEPEVKANKEVRKMFEEVIKELDFLTDADGLITPEILMAFRKEGLNAVLDGFLQGGGTATAKRSATSAMATIKPMLDNVFDEATGGGWTTYLRTYQSLSQPVNQGAVGRVLQKSFTDAVDPEKIQPRVLMNALGDEKKVLDDAGIKVGNKLEDVMTPDQMRQIDALRADLARAEKTQNLAAQGRPARDAATEVPEMQLTNPLMREIMIANAVLRKLSQGKKDEVQTALVDLFKRDPDKGYAAMADALEKATDAQRPQIYQLIESAAKTAGELATPVTATIGGNNAKK